MASTSQRGSTLVEGIVAVECRPHGRPHSGARRSPSAPGRSDSLIAMFLLDTNVISELRRPRPHGAVLAWLESVPDQDLHLSAVTLGEIQSGIELTREQDAAKAAEIEMWADRVAASYNVLPMDSETFREWARLLHRKSDTLYEDAMIAATARQHKLTVVTRNVADFSHFDVQLLNPFE
jgi:predicted nucleic acid-binding protein